MFILIWEKNIQINILLKISFNFINKNLDLKFGTKKPNDINILWFTK